MLKNYLFTAFRNLYRNKLFSLINVGGLSLALAASILIIIFVRYETGFETWMEDSDRIYRVETEFHFPGRDPMEFSYSPGPMKGLFEKEFSNEISDTVRIRNERTGISHNERRFIERVSYVDENFFEVFDLPAIMGNRESALQDTSSILISESMAKKYFANDNPVGKTLALDNLTSVRVVGVFKDIPDNSHLSLEFLMRLDPIFYNDAPWVLERWGSVNLFTYFRLKKGANINAVKARMVEALDRNANFGPEGAPDATPSDHFFPHFLAARDIHLFANRTGDMKPGGNITTVLAFGTIAALILVIAGVNFTNLSTARALKRAGEIGVRKSLGASRGQLVRQFLVEAVVVSLLALLGALVLVEIALPWYSEVLVIGIGEGWMQDPGIMGYGVLAAVLVGLGGGLYPAIYLSSLRPNSILVPGVEGPKGNPATRNVLVGFQFAISIALMIMTATVIRQTEYARNADLGFATENRVVLRGLSDQTVRPVAETIRLEITRLPGVLDAAFSHDAPPLRNDIATRTILSDSSDSVLLERVIVGSRFFDLYEIPPIAGRTFGNEYRGDFLDPAAGAEATFSVVINLSGVHLLGVSDPAEAIGQTAKMEISEGVFATATIVGVVDDIKLRSLHRDVTPMVFWTMDVPLNYLTVHLSQGKNQESTMMQIDRIWQNLAPEAFLSRTGLKEQLEGLYWAEEQAANIFSYFAIFAILVSAMGLFGLAGYSTERRTKEIGLRKVLGGKVSDILRLFLWQFSKPVLWASAVGLPLAAYLASQWLEKFAYRIELRPFEFAVAVLSAIFVSWVAVGINAVRVARTNPIKALRYE